MGESRDRTIIKLRNNCPGYQDPANPRAMLFTASGSKNSPYCDWAGKGEGEEAYDADLCNFTVDVGSGNPGAIGIDYLGHNEACVRNVSIRSSDGQGAVGLSMLRKSPGPLLVSNVRISGFDYGIRVKDSLGPTLEHVSLTGQHIAGIENQNALLTLRDLTSANSVPAVTSCSKSDLLRYSLLVLLDANLNGGASNQPAIQIQGVGNYLLRNINTTGYQSALQNDGRWISGASITELVSDTVRSLFPSPAKTLGLPVRETPVYENNNPSDWVNVKDYGALAGKPGTQDAAPAFQAAIDAGKPVVYVPWGSYVLGSTVKIRGNVRKIIGFGAELHPLNDTSFKAGVPLFRVESNTVDTVFIEHLVFAKNCWVKNEPVFANPVIEHASTAALAIKDLIVGGFANQPGSGPVFIENVCCKHMEFINTEAWCRQLNPEEVKKTNSLHVINNGSKLWILGLKTESEGTIIKTINNGFTEMLGGFHFLWYDSATPAFINTESSLSLSYITGNECNYANHEVETRDGITRTLTRADLLRRWRGSAVPLYSGYRGHESER